MSVVDTWNSLATIPPKNLNDTHSSNTSNDSSWTTNSIIEILKQHLATIVYEITNSDGKTVEGRKYYDQTEYLQHRIAVYKPTPIFKIYLSDLSPEIVKELHNLDIQTRQFVIKQAVGRIFEDLNPELYHNSISSVLKVGMQS